MSIGERPTEPLKSATRAPRSWNSGIEFRARVRAFADSDKVTSQEQVSPLQPSGALTSPSGNQIVRLLPVANLARQHVEEGRVVIAGVDAPDLGSNGYLWDVLNRLPSMTNRQIQTLTPEVWLKARPGTAASLS